MADGRHLWRVFDNLLNNIYKYAQAGSRVYLNVEHDGQDVRIIFRNMSAFRWRCHRRNWKSGSPEETNPATWRATVWDYP